MSIQFPTSNSIEVAVETNVSIVFLNRPVESAARLGSGVRVVVSLAVLGELFSGARRSKRVAQNLLRVEDFARRARVLPCDIDTARQFGIVRAALQTAGTPIPEDDMWIAACAIQFGLPLLTEDKHFDSVPGLQVVKW